jgi:hypothetical protein
MRLTNLANCRSIFFEVFEQTHREGLRANAEQADRVPRRLGPVFRLPHREDELGVWICLDDLLCEETWRDCKELRRRRK